MSNPKWSVSDLTHAKSVGEISFRDVRGQRHDFQVIITPDRVVFGGACNAGFLESGYILRDEGESLQETLQEMLSDLDVYYNDGESYVSRIVCNERM